MTIFNLLLAPAAALVLVILGYVVKGLGNGTLNGGTLLPWFTALVLPLLLIGFAWSARARGAKSMALALLILALPVGLGCVLFVHLLSWTGRWN